MKLILISPPSSLAALPSLGMARVAAWAEKLGCETAQLDFNLVSYIQNPHIHNSLRCNDLDEKFDNFCKNPNVKKLTLQWCNQILSQNPDIVGFHLLVYSVGMGCAMAIQLKEMAPSLQIIAGGPACHPTCHGKTLINKGFFHQVIWGPGELYLNSIIENARKNSKKNNNYENSEYKISKNHIKYNIISSESLDNLPPPVFSPHHLKEYPWQALPIIATTGCQNRCAFCTDHVFSPTVFKRNPKSVVKEMEYLSKKYDITSFFFNDSDLTGSGEYLLELCDEILNSPIKFSLSGIGRIPGPPILLEKSIKAMKSAGFKSLQIGVECASDRILVQMGKNVTVRDISRFLRLCGRHDLPVDINLMPGFPTEKSADFLKTIHFTYKHRKYIKAISVTNTCMINPGSRLYEKATDFGVKMHKINPYWISQGGKNTYEIRKIRQAILGWACSLFVKSVSIDRTQPIEKRVAFALALEKKHPQKAFKLIKKLVNKKSSSWLFSYGISLSVKAELFDETKNLCTLIEKADLSDSDKLEFYRLCRNMITEKKRLKKALFFSKKTLVYNEYQDLIAHAWICHDLKRDKKALKAFKTALDHPLATPRDSDILTLNDLSAELEKNRANIAIMP